MEWSWKDINTQGERLCSPHKAFKDLYFKWGNVCISGVALNPLLCPPKEIHEMWPQICPQPGHSGADFSAIRTAPVIFYLTFKQFFPLRGLHSLPTEISGEIGSRRIWLYGIGLWQVQLKWFIVPIFMCEVFHFLKPAVLLRLHVW